MGRACRSWRALVFAGSTGMVPGVAWCSPTVEGVTSWLAGEIERAKELPRVEGWILRWERLDPRVPSDEEVAAMAGAWAWLRKRARVARDAQW